MGESLECDEMMQDLNCGGCIHEVDCKYEWAYYECPGYNYGER